MKKMQAVLILTAATVTLALDNVASAGTFECEADHQCNSGHCYLETGKCVSCIDCARYLRQSFQWRTCARGPQDCGECLAGFEYDYLTDGTTRSFCVRKKGIEILSVRSPYLWMIIVSSVGMFVCIVYVAIKSLIETKSRSGVHNSGARSGVRNPDAEDPPPLNNYHGNDNSPPSYDSSIPLLRNAAGVSSALVTSLTVVEKEGSTLQQAVPFSHADPPYGVGGPVEHENEVEVPVLEFSPPPSSLTDSGSESEEHRAISPPPLEDEDTMPSEWVPSEWVPPYRERASEEPPDEESSSMTSSLSDISHSDNSAGVTLNAQEGLNDSGVSASCSHQSDLSFAHGEENLDVLTSGQDTSASAIHAVLHHHRSEEDLSTLSEIRDRKRQRRDSGSSSMTSVEPYRERI